jgi:hypothetical protein
MKDVCVHGLVGVGGCRGGEVSVEVQVLQPDAGSALPTGRWNATTAAGCSLSPEMRGLLLPSVVVDGGMPHHRTMPSARRSRVGSGCHHPWRLVIARQSNQIEWNPRVKSNRILDGIEGAKHLTLSRTSLRATSAPSLLRATSGAQDLMRRGMKDLARRERTQARRGGAGEAGRAAGDAGAMGTAAAQAR